MKILKIIRRLMVSLVLLIFLVVGIYFYARYIEPDMLITKKYHISIPKEVVPSKIVFFSDTHFGKLYNQKNLNKIVNKINKQEPDIIIFGGDFFDHYGRDRNSLDLTYIKSELANMKAKYGKYAVFGNHDYGGGAAQTYEEVMIEAGFTLIKNNYVYVEELNLRLIGFDDYLLGYTDPSLYDIKSEGFNVVISHEPDIADNISLPQEGLMLSGHSHGGQVSLPFITEKVLPIGAKKYVKGAYENMGEMNNMTLLVSKGIGMTGQPFRFLNIPEILVVELTR